MIVDWHKARSIIHYFFVTTGVLLSAFVIVGLFGYVNEDASYYCNFAVCIILMSGLLAIRHLLDEHLAGNRNKYFSMRCVIALTGFILAMIGNIYIIENQNQLALIQPFFENIDIKYGLFFIVGVLLLTLLHWGITLFLVLVLAIVYLFYGHHIDNIYFNHPHYDVNFVMNYLVLGANQGFFLLIDLSADSVFFLVIYASLLVSTGALELTSEMSKLCGNKFVGGTAYPPILTSGLTSSLTGQAVTNATLTGEYTIPMMKKHGYPASMAAAIEAVASTAGQLMPPLLGLAGFLMAAILNIPYIDVVGAALIPALLFLVGIGISVSMYARQQEIPKYTDSIDTARIFKTLPAFVGSIVVVLCLLLLHHSPLLAGLAGIATVLAFTLLEGEYKPTKTAIFHALERGFVAVTLLSLLIVAIGPLGQTLITTNLSGRLSIFLIDTLPEVPLLLLFGTMFVIVTIGVGMPTPIAYMIAAWAIVPFLLQLGFPAFEAHFFVFYFAVISALTPPLPAGSLVTSKLAGSKFVPTALNALKLTVPSFLIPFAVLHSPDIFMIESWTWRTPLLFIALVLIQAGIAAAIFIPYSRHLRQFHRILLLLVSLSAFYFVFLQ